MNGNVVADAVSVEIFYFPSTSRLHQICWEIDEAIGTEPMGTSHTYEHRRRLCETLPHKQKKKMKS